MSNLSYRELCNLPHTYDSFGFVLGYDFKRHKWEYDVKFYLVGNNWCRDPEGESVFREVTEREQKTIKQYMPIVEAHEKENAAWLAQKHCRKRSCVCKKCEKSCHCSDCTNPFTECNNVY